jgi:hypothetical protein
MDIEGVMEKRSQPDSGWRSCKVSEVSPEPVSDERGRRRGCHIREFSVGGMARWRGCHRPSKRWGR